MRLVAIRYGGGFFEVCFVLLIGFCVKRIKAAAEVARLVFRA